MLTKLLLLACTTQVFARYFLKVPLVEIPGLGQVEGDYGESSSNKSFYKFEGVPYATPPVGKYRFEKARPIMPWNGVWTAKTIYRCMQNYNGNVKDRVIGDEDCLYINIYTPTIDKNANLDVLVYIHGGAFMYNYGGLHGPQYIMNKNIVYINLNYRLGPLGFLSTEDNVVPGNNGLKDQTLALKFIKQHVKYFGGNPESITIMGMSAGGASVNFHYFSEESRGLFHRGISQSGTLLDPWVLTEKPLEKAQKLSANLGCSTKSTRKMIKCLKNRPGRQIVEQVKSFQPWLYNPFSPFAVVVDKWAINPVLPEHPYLLIKNKKMTDLPWIASYTGSEGLYPGSFFYKEHLLDELDSQWNKLLPHILDYNYTANQENHDTISEEIRQKYLGNEKLTSDSFPKLLRLLTDRLFKAGIRRSVQLQAAAMTSPVYMYDYTYRGAHSKSESWSGSTKNFGASHGDDTAMVLYLNMDTASREDDREMQDLMINLVTSFAKTGKPKVSIDWPPVSKDSANLNNCLHISGSQNLTIVDLGFPQEEFWNSLPIIENEKLFT